MTARRTTTVSLGAVLALLAVAPPIAWGECVLLRNGSVLTGRVDRQGDRVLVRGEGSVMRLRAADVVRVDETKLALYEWRRSQTPAAALTVDDHLGLADWALANGMAAQAARELLDARQLDPRSPRLALLERRLAEAIRPRPEVMTQPQPAPTPAPPEAIAADPLPPLPDHTREAFARRVQRIVLNGCGAGGCHGGARPDDSFPLDPSLLRGYGTAATTRRNLAAVLGAIDADDPAKSRLLVAAQGPHHGATPFAGPRRRELLEHLSAWVHEVAAPSPLAPSDAPADETIVDILNGAAPADPAAQAEPTAATTASTGGPDGPPEAAAPKNASATSADPTPRDEFDPVIFNTRFRRPQDDLPVAATR